MSNMGTKHYLLPIVFATLNFFVCSIQAKNVTNNITEYPIIQEHTCIPGPNELCVPTCCGPNGILRRTKENEYVCEDYPAANKTYQYEVFESNQTHINTASKRKPLPVYQQSLTCNESRILEEDENGSEFACGFIFNSSIILMDLSKKEVSLIPPSKYCVDYREINITIFHVCGARPKPVPSVEYIFYFIFLVASTICYFISAGFYILVLKINEIHKKCFVGYTISMGLAFMFLIFLQSFDYQCNILGFFFYFFLVCGFLWLMFLCLDLVVEVRSSCFVTLFLWIKFSTIGHETLSCLTYYRKFFNEAQNVERWVYYIAASIFFPFLMVFISIIPDGLIDVPKAFTKDFYYGHVYCKFNESRLEFFFVTVGILMVASLVFLCASIYYIRINNRDYRNQFCWLDRRSSYKYMFRSCLLSWILALVWVVEIIITEKIFEEYGVVLPRTLYLIEAVQGICALLLFVSNRYTRKEISKILCPRSSNEPNNMEILLQQLAPKENTNNCNPTPEEASKLTEESTSEKPET